ncbi:hypothetical protein ACQPZP_33445 [Spirillospora sp. CA-142024]
MRFLDQPEFVAVDEVVGHRVPRSRHPADGVDVAKANALPADEAWVVGF